MLLIKDLELLFNQVDILPKLPNQELAILLKYQLDWKKIVDFLPLAYFEFWVSPILYCSYFTCKIGSTAFLKTFSKFVILDLNWNRFHPTVTSKEPTAISQRIGMKVGDKQILKQEVRLHCTAYLCKVDNFCPIRLWQSDLKRF